MKVIINNKRCKQNDLRNGSLFYKLLNDNRDFLRNILLYGIIGATSAFLDTVIFITLVIKLDINKLIANLISVNCGIILSFILNSTYNFRKTNKLLRRIIIFYSVGLLGLLLSNGILTLGGYFLLPVVTVKVASVFIVAAFQFILNKFITFRN